jgi:hypothetical protein
MAYNEIRKSHIKWSSLQKYWENKISLSLNWVNKSQEAAGAKEGCFRSRLSPQESVKVTDSLSIFNNEIFK